MISLQFSVPKEGAERQSLLVELRSSLASLPSGFGEIWVDHAPFPSLCALLNEDLGWLMWIRNAGDPGFSSRNPRYSGPRELQVEFSLGVGQVDGYPAGWCYSRSEIVDAIIQFASTGRTPDSMMWFNDSGDGATYPWEAPHRD